MKTQLAPRGLPTAEYLHTPPHHTTQHHTTTHHTTPQHTTSHHTNVTFWIGQSFGEVKISGKVKNLERSNVRKIKIVGK